MVSCVLDSREVAYRDDGHQDQLGSYGLDRDLGHGLGVVHHDLL